MITPVILCGGSGSRLWPLSRKSHPKQFVDFKNNGSSLYIDTLRRATALKDISKPITVCNNEYKFFVLQSLLATGEYSSVIVEPVARNTAPAIAVAAFKAFEEDSESILLVMPSDHYVEQDSQFGKKIKEAVELAKKDYLVTFGIKPLEPKTGFGYIEKGTVIEAQEAYKVASFIEKPNSQLAEEMIYKGNFLWNSGIFIFKSKIFLEELRTYAPNIYKVSSLAWEKRRVSENFYLLNTTAFEDCPSESVDYAVFEKTSKAAVVPLNIHWNDLGTWNALYEEGEKDKKGNVIFGDVVLSNSNNSYFHSTGRLIAGIGLNDLIVVETKDAVLISPLKEAQKVKNLVQELSNANKEEAVSSPIVYRPWGSYESLSKGDRFQVKRIIVQPGQKLSLQMHYHRAEHWIVVNGTAEVHIEDEVKLLSENESIFIPLGKKHRLLNPGKLPLIVIEVQSGSYLGEDDILRLEDAYQRS